MEFKVGDKVRIHPPSNWSITDQKLFEGKEGRIILIKKYSSIPFAVKLTIGGQCDNWKKEELEFIE